MDNNYICKYCNKTFVRKSDLIRHLNKYHKDKKIEHRRKCKNPNCNNQIIYYTWENWEDIITKYKVYCSSKCEIEYNPRTKYKQNCECPICHKYLANSLLLERHLKVCKKRICPYCNKEFFNATDYNYHIKICDKLNGFRCEFCNKVFHTESILKQHLSVIHKDKIVIKKIKCENPNCDNYIDEKYIGKYSFGHNHTCSNKCAKILISINNSNKKIEKPFKCSACKYAFNTKEKLDNHFKKRHLNPEYNNVCIICGARFSNKSTLNRHYMNFHEDKIYTINKRCENPNCNNYIEQLMIDKYILNTKQFCSHKCASAINGKNASIKFWKNNPKNKERRYKLTLQYNGCKWFDYTDKKNNKHRVQGTYELAFAKKLDELNIDFITHPNGFKYINNNKITYYFPDFYIPSKNVYIDTKAEYYLKLSGDKFKIFREQHPEINLLILTEKYLKLYGLNNIYEYIKNLIDK